MIEASIQPLNRVPPKRRGTVVKLEGGRGLQDRLVSMGLNVGCVIEVIHNSNGRGGPTLIAVGETRLAIGHGMSDKILVAVEPE